MRIAGLGFLVMRVLMMVLLDPVALRAETAPTDALSYDRSPVFMERYFENYQEAPENLTLLPQARVHLYQFPVADMEGFDWRSHVAGDDLSWWIRVEWLAYTLPLIARFDEEDQRVLRDWIGGWLDAHESEPFINVATKDAMTVGIRAAVLTWYLKRIDAVSSRSELIPRLKRSLEWHQTYLWDNYRPMSNHGFWESMGLFETTRVHPDETIRRLALDRLGEMLQLYVTESGLGVEHAMDYQMEVSMWITDFGKYLHALGLAEGGEAKATAGQMNRATYYVYDHRGNVAQIGDADERRLSPDEMPLSEREVRRMPLVLYDPSAGLALYKDPPGSTRRRHVAFCIQNGAAKPQLTLHYHNDVLALYYSDDGEVILGDQGRYSYHPNDDKRRYFQSNLAHNTLGRTRDFRPWGRAIKLASDAWWQAEDDHDLWGAALDGGEITRVVELPRERSEVNVRDTIVGNDRYTVLWYLGRDVQSVTEIDRREEPGTRWRIGGRPWRVYEWRLGTRRGRSFTLTVRVRSKPGLAPDLGIIVGQDSPFFGWYSPTYNVAVPTKVVRLDMAVEDFAQIVTTVRPDGGE